VLASIAADADFHAVEEDDDADADDAAEEDNDW